VLLRILRLRSATLRLNKRVQELAAVGTLSLSMTALWGYNIWHIKGEAEASVFKATVGVLRTSLALNHLQQILPPPGGALPASERQAGAPNPFVLLLHRPASYVGEVSMRQAGQLAPGSWLFEPDCRCIGYVPLSAEWLSSPSGDRMIWIRIISGQPDQLQLREHYLWQGKPLD
jgi:hypothetical protein